MNYDEIRLTLRPRTVFEVLDLSLVFFRRSLPSLWPLLLAVWVFWIAGMWLVSYLQLDMRLRIGALLVWLLFLRYWMQVFLVIACGRLAFAERLPWAEVFSDLRSVGPWRTMARGGLRLLKWASGFLLFLPLWIVFVRRCFDYEHWLLERLSGADLARRLKAFQADQRIVVFRLLHLVFLIVSMGLGYRLLKISLDVITRGSLLSPAIPEVWMSLFLLYDPFFIVSRFLFYIQIRTDEEAWDVGILMRQGIRRTLNRLLPLFLLLGLFASGDSLSADPVAEGGSDFVACTPLMKEQPYLKCDPPGYHEYTAEEVEKHIPPEPGKVDWLPGWLKKLGLPGADLLYAVAAVLLIGFLFGIWRRFASRLPPEEAPPEVSLQATELPARMSRDMESLLGAAEAALQREMARDALGFAYGALLLLAAENAQSCTPLELRRRLLESSSIEHALLRSFFLHYLAAFYADQVAPVDVVRPILMQLSQTLRSLSGGGVAV